VGDVEIEKEPRTHKERAGEKLADILPIDSHSQRSSRYL
jgi:hypothetical protein